MTRAPWLSGLLVVGLPLVSAGQTPAKTIAVWPVRLPQRFEVLREARTAFNALIAQQLRAVGYSLVLPAETERVWRHARDSLGGYYDTYTGRVDSARFEAVQAAARRGLTTEFHADAWLVPSIQIVPVPFGGGKVKWHGTEEESGGTGGLVGFLLGRDAGTISALSLHVRVEDMSGNELYSRYGGIQLLNRVQGDRLVMIPMNSVLSSAARNEAAVHLALDSLVTVPALSPRP